MVECVIHVVDDDDDVGSTFAPLLDSKMVSFASTPRCKLAIGIVICVHGDFEMKYQIDMKIVDNFFSSREGILLK